MRLVILTLAGAALLLASCSDDTTSGNPDSSATKDMATKKDGPVTKKDGPVAKKDGPVAKKDGPVTKKDGPVTKKDGPVTKKDGPVTKPDGPVTKPDQKMPKPDMNLSVPDSGAASCKAQDIKGLGMCKMIIGYKWDGKACQPVAGCYCGGTDCAKISKTSTICQKTFAHCSKPKCTAWDAKGVGMCSMFLGYIWDGKQCKGISGCSCGGTDCHRIYSSPTKCSAGQASCSATPSCKPMNVKGVGACKLLLGWYFDGKQCKSLGGCSCAGTDCGKLYKNSAACQAAYQGCP